MKTLIEYIRDARNEKKAIGHFNISNLDGFWAIYNSAKKQNLPVVIGVSEKERDAVGVKQSVALVRSLREGEGYPIFLNADHTYSFERVKEAVDAGFDAVIFDGAKMTLDENIAETRKCVEYARASGKNVLIEGELGYIGQSSKILDAIPEGAAITEEQLTTIEDASRFVRETGVDLFSPAVGSIHGMLRAAKDPDLNVKRILSISSAVDTPLVLHGASGLRDENVKEAIDAGIAHVHINTEIRVAFRDALRDFISANPDEVAPYKITEPSRVAMEKVITDKLKLFWS